jgi:hypothetical protein
MTAASSLILVTSWIAYKDFKGKGLAGDDHPVATSNIVKLQPLQVSAAVVNTTDELFYYK